jgi:hypothetical protein
MSPEVKMPENLSSDRVPRPTVSGFTTLTRSVANITQKEGSPQEGMQGHEKMLEEHRKKKWENHTLWLKRNHKKRWESLVQWHQNYHKKRGVVLWWDHVVICPLRAKQIFPGSFKELHGHREPQIHGQWSSR